jgi:hypothetical protein
MVKRRAQSGDDLEARLAAAKLEAARRGSAVVVCHAGQEVALVWPNGQIDIQSSGAELISARPPR